MNLKEEVSSDSYFHLADGRVLKSVPELIETLRDMDEWVFQHHVNSDKNDFVQWIEHISEIN